MQSLAIPVKTAETSTMHVTTAMIHSRSSNELPLRVGWTGTIASDMKTQVGLELIAIPTKFIDSARLKIRILQVRSPATACTGLPFVSGGISSSSKLFAYLGGEYQRLSWSGTPEVGLLLRSHPNM